MHCARLGTNRLDVSILEKVNETFIFGPFTYWRPWFYWGWCLVGLDGSILCAHIQSLWIQTNMEPGSRVNAVRSSRVLLGQELRPAVLIIEDGKIKQIKPHSADIACEVTKTKKLHTLKLLSPYIPAAVVGLTSCTCFLLVPTGVGCG